MGIKIMTPHRENVLELGGVGGEGGGDGGGA